MLAMGPLQVDTTQPYPERRHGMHPLPPSPMQARHARVKEDCREGGEEEESKGVVRRGQVARGDRQLFIWQLDGLNKVGNDT